ncbi:MAG: tRNA1(Val) (adenine(37)-N6)-methyltransferase [Rhodospirillales bacterium]
MQEDALPPTTAGTLLGGRIAFAQPATGYRAAIDPVLLAASVPCAARTALELGAGAGAATLCLAARCPALAVAAAERDPVMARLARRNVAANAMDGRVTVIEADIRALSREAHGRFAAVFFNPPFLPPGRASVSPDGGRRAANVEAGAGLVDWVAIAARMLAPRGALRLIHRADRLHEVMAALARHFGDIAVLPLWPRAGVPAKRILVAARLGARGGARLLPGLVLHEGGGGFSAGAQAVLRDGASLEDAFGPVCAL